MNRGQLETHLRAICGHRTKEAMALVDAYVQTLRDMADPGRLWTAEEVREFLGMKSVDAVRVTMSRWGIEAVRYHRTGRGGQGRAYYSAAQVIAAAADRNYVPNQRDGSSA